jgi:RNA polymerase sigma factor (sigma-70 family)
LDVAVAKGRAARRAFVTHNFGLAARVADDIYGKLSDSDRGLLSRDDLTLYGCAGLARAADRFDPDRGYKFSTYCYFWVRKAVLDGVKDCGRTIRLPKYLSEVLRETRKAERDLEAKLGRAPSDIELAEATKVDVTRVREWRNWAQAPLSLDAGAGGGAADADNGALVDGIAAAAGSTSGVPTQSVRHTEDGPSASAEADADADLLRDALDEALATLLPREQFVLRHRFGLASASARALACASTSDGAPPGWLHASSADEAEAMVRAEGKDGASRLLLGSLLGVSAETVRTVERRALAKLKQPSRLGAVLPHVDDETRARMEQSDEGGLFAAALAEAAEKADRRAGGGARLRGCRRSGPGERAPGSRRRREKKESAARGEAPRRRRGDASRAAGRKCRGPRARKRFPGRTPRRRTRRIRRGWWRRRRRRRYSRFARRRYRYRTAEATRRDARTQFSFFIVYYSSKRKLPSRARLLESR